MWGVLLTLPVFLLRPKVDGATGQFARSVDPVGAVDAFIKGVFGPDADCEGMRHMFGPDTLVPNQARGFWRALGACFAAGTGGAPGATVEPCVSRGMPCWSVSVTLRVVEPAATTEVRVRTTLEQATSLFHLVELVQIRDLSTGLPPPPPPKRAPCNVVVARDEFFWDSDLERPAGAPPVGTSLGAADGGWAAFLTARNGKMESEGGFTDYIGTTLKPLGIHPMFAMNLENPHDSDDEGEDFFAFGGSMVEFLQKPPGDATPELLAAVARAQAEAKELGLQGAAVEAHLMKAMMAAGFGGDLDGDESD